MAANGWLKQAVLRELIDAYPKPVSVRLLVENIYGGHAYAETDEANNIAVTTHKLNQTLPALGWQIAVAPRGYRALRAIGE